jgi:hypothetical protein
MSRPDDIPQEIWDRASEVVCDEGVYAKGASHLILVERCARAIHSLEESYAAVCETLNEITATANASEWRSWEQGKMQPPTFRLHETIEAEHTDGSVATGYPYVFHWYPESSRGEPIVKRWRVVAANNPA